MQIKFNTDCDDITISYVVDRNVYLMESVSTQGGGATFWTCTPQEMNAWVDGRGYRAAFDAAHAALIAAQVDTFSPHQVQVIKIAQDNAKLWHEVAVAVVDTDAGWEAEAITAQQTAAYWSALALSYLAGVA